MTQSGKPYVCTHTDKDRKDKRYKTAKPGCLQVLALRGIFTHFFFFLFSAMQCGMWDLSFPLALPTLEGQVLTTGKSLYSHLKYLHILVFLNSLKNLNITGVIFMKYKRSPVTAL